MSVDAITVAGHKMNAEVWSVLHARRDFVGDRALGKTTTLLGFIACCYGMSRLGEMPIVLYRCSREAEFARDFWRRQFLCKREPSFMRVGQDPQGHRGDLFTDEVPLWHPACRRWLEAVETRSLADMGGVRSWGAENFWTVRHG